LYSSVKAAAVQDCNGYTWEFTGSEGHVVQCYW